MEIDQYQGLALTYFLGRYIEEIREEPFITEELWSDFLLLLETHKDKISKWIPEDKIWNFDPPLELVTDDKFVPGKNFPSEIEDFYDSLFNFKSTNWSLEVISE